MKCRIILKIHKSGKGRGLVLERSIDSKLDWDMENFLPQFWMSELGNMMKIGYIFLMNILYGRYNFLIWKNCCSYEVVLNTSILMLIAWYLWTLVLHCSVDLYCHTGRCFSTFCALHMQAEQMSSNYVEILMAGPVHRILLVNMSSELRIVLWVQASKNF